MAEKVFDLPLAIYADDCVGMTRADYDALTARLAEAERLLCEAGDRIVYHTRGSTHYNGCELVHPDCKVLMEIGRLKNGMRPSHSAEVAPCKTCDGESYVVNYRPGEGHAPKPCPDCTTVTVTEGAK